MYKGDSERDRDGEREGGRERERGRDREGEIERERERVISQIHRCCSLTLFHYQCHSHTMVQKYLSCHLFQSHLSL